MASIYNDSDIFYLVILVWMNADSKYVKLAELAELHTYLKCKLISKMTNFLLTRQHFLSYSVIVSYSRVKSQ